MGDSAGKRLAKRAWLNPVGSYSNGVMKVCVEPGYWAGRCEGTVMIGDCRRLVELDFSYNSPAEQKAAVRKLDKIMDMLDLVKSAIASGDYEGEADKE